jgi:hypothetical protein
VQFYHIILPEDKQVGWRIKDYGKQGCGGVWYRIYGKLAFYLHRDDGDHEIDFLCSSGLEAIF